EIVADDFKPSRTASKIVGLFRQLKCPVNWQSRSGACQLDWLNRGHSFVSGNVRRCSIESRASDVQIADNSVPRCHPRFRRAQQPNKVESKSLDIALHWRVRKQTKFLLRRNG